MGLRGERIDRYGSKRRRRMLDAATATIGEGEGEEVLVSEGGGGRVGGRL